MLVIKGEDPWLSDNTDACMNPVRSIAEGKVAAQTVATRFDIIVKPWLLALPSAIDIIWKTQAAQIAPAAKEIPYYARPSSHWGINE
jgi:hypothetical protein